MAVIFGMVKAVTHQKDVLHLDAGIIRPISSHSV
jgi:hypothetical protein